MQQVATFLFDTALSIVSMLHTSWGIIGSSIIAIFVLDRVVNFVKRFFN